jgi:hypothetical protein
MRALSACFIIVFFVVQLPATSLSDSNFIVIETPQSDYSDTEAAAEYNEALEDSGSDYNKELREQESIFRDNKGLKQDSAVKYNEDLSEQKSSFRDNEELKEDSAVQFNEGLGDSVDYNESL